MKTETQQHLGRAEELLRVANELLQNGHFPDSVSRSYYAMFHAASAALLERGIERGSHRGVISAFSEFLVKPGHLDRRFHLFLREGFDARSECDYWASPSGTAEDAQHILVNASELVEACGPLCLKPPS